MGSAASVDSEPVGKAADNSDAYALPQGDYSSPQSESLKMLALGKAGYKDVERSYVNTTEFNHPPEVKWKTPENKAVKQINLDSPSASTNIKIHNQAVKTTPDTSQRIGPPPLRAPPPRRTMPGPHQPQQIVTGVSGNPLTQQVMAPSIHPPPRIALQGPPQAYSNIPHQNDIFVSGMNSNNNTGRYTNRNTTSGNNSSRDPKVVTSAPPTSEPRVVPKEDHKKSEIKRQYADDEDDDEDGDEQVYDWTVFDTADIKSTRSAINDGPKGIGSDASIDKGKSSMLTTKPIGGKNIPIKPFPYESNDHDDSMIASFANENTSIRDNFKKPAIVPSLSIPASSSVADVSKHHISSGKIPAGSGIVPPLRKISTPSAPNSAVSSSDKIDNSPARTVPSSPIVNAKNKMTSQSPVINRRPTAPKPNKEPPHAVIETSDVKRNKAQLPSTLTHAKPTTGDWLKKRYIVNNYILLDTLGTGSYGEVKLSKDRTTDTLYAVKIMSKDLLKKKKGTHSLTHTLFTASIFTDELTQEEIVTRRILRILNERLLL